MDKLMIVAGLLTNSALFLIGCFIAGMVEGNGVAWKASVASCGAIYFVYALQLVDGVPAPVAAALNILAVLLGAISFLSLLIFS